MTTAKTPDEGSRTDETYRIRSINRPLTRGAKQALAECGLVDTGHREAIVSERPDRETLDKHELQVVESPVVVFDSGLGEVRIFEDRVINNGVESSMEPQEAMTKAIENGWEVVEGKPEL